jgi:uncharacterized protein (TIGR03000 family)
MRLRDEAGQGKLPTARGRFIMSRLTSVFRLCAFVAAGVLALAAIPLEAGSGGRGGGGHGGGGYYGGYHGGYHGGYGGYYHGYYGHYHGGFYGYYRGYGWGYGGFGLYGYLPYPYWGFGGIAVGSPGYLPYGAAGDYYPLAGPVAPPPSSSLDAPPSEAPPQPKPDGAARLLLLVPANAQVWFDDDLRTQGGTEREYVSPQLTPNKVYVYSVRVRYVKDDGTVFDDTRPIRVRANDRWVVDFTRPAPRMKEAPPEDPEVNPKAAPR